MEIKLLSINGQKVNDPKFKEAETDSKTFFYDESFEDYKKNPFNNIEIGEAATLELVLAIEYDEKELTEEQIEKIKKIKYDELES